MINNVISINRQGLSHEQCEDSVYIDKINSVFVVCDGVSNSLYGGEGAKTLSAYIGKVIANEQIKKHLAVDNVLSVRETMVKHIKKSSELTVQKLGCELRDISSTMIVVSVWNGVITVIHAGDGGVFAAPEVCQDEVPILLSYPDNDAEQKVFPAASPTQIERMRVIRLKASDIKCLAFGTDGFTDAYLRPHTSGFDGYGLNEVFKANNNDELEELIKRKHLKRPAITDDISAIILKFDNAVEYKGIVNLEPPVKPTEDKNKLTIKNENENQTDNDFQEKEVISKSCKANTTTNKAKKTFLVILSTLVICCMVAVGVLGNNLKTVNNNSEKQISNLSEEISSLQHRIDELENAMTEESTTTSNEDMDSRDYDDVTEATENSTEEKPETQSKEPNADTTEQSSSVDNQIIY